MDNNITSVMIEYDQFGSLATTHETQCADMGLFGGLMGMDVIDQRLVDSETLISKSGIRIDMKIREFNDEHPNTYRLKLSNSYETHTIKALSTGGGMIKIIAIDDIPVEIEGDYWENLILTADHNESNILREIQAGFEYDFISTMTFNNKSLIQIKSRKPFPEKLAESLKSNNVIIYTKIIEPVLPILSSKDSNVPFNNCSELLEYVDGRDIPLWKPAVEYESQRGIIPEEDVINRMINIVSIVRQSVENGISGTKYDDRILGYQSGRFKDCIEKGKVLDSGLTNKIILYVSALMEVKSSMGIIVAAPTAGSCAALPGACLAAGDWLPGKTDEDIAKAMLAGGLIGIFIAHKSTFSAEEAGCQAECGAGSGMAAAALTTLAGGTLIQSISAATMALQNSFGMVCDPVANRVEVPCLGKNVMAAVNALSCANMALADYDPVTTLDETIMAMDQAGRSIVREFRCTALGGLSITESSKKLERDLAEKKKTRK